MKEHKIVVIGASSGGLEPLRQLFRELKPDLNAAFFVVLHMAPDADSHLPAILGRYSSIQVEQAQDAKKIQPGHAYIAPPNQHLVIQDSTMRLTFGPKVNHTRPAVDPLFESAAKNYGPNVIGIILSGNLYDGTKGMISIKQAGGVAVVQDPEDALFSGMPDSVLRYVQVDYTLPISEIASLLNKLTDKTILGKGETQVTQPVPDLSEDEIDLIKKEMEIYEQGYLSSQHSVLTCPDCGGVLWEIHDGKLIRYRCHTGHIYNAETLLASYDNEYEKAFWTAIRVMVEKGAIANRLALNAQKHGNKQLEEQYLAIAREAEKESDRIRATWFDGKAKRSKNESAGDLANEEITRSTD